MIIVAEKVFDGIYDIAWWKISLVYAAALGVAWILYAVLHLFWGSYMLMTPGQLFGDGVSLEGLGRVWLLFVWAFIAPLILLCVGERSVTRLTRVQLLFKGLWISLNAGVFEEIIYRVFVFLSAMVMLTFFNFITFGLVAWVNSVILLPVANFMTFHALQPQLLESGWLMGAAILSALASFRNSHKQLGLIAYVNAWFCGFVLFWLMFNYGLFTAIVAHVLYDCIVFTMSSFTKRCAPMLAR